MTLIYKVMYIIAIDLFNLIFDSVSRNILKQHNNENI